MKGLIRPVPRGYGGFNGLRHCRRHPLEDWRIGGLVDWGIGGLVDWWIGGLVDWRMLVDWWIGGLVDWRIIGFLLIFKEFDFYRFHRFSQIYTDFQ